MKGTDTVKHTWRCLPAAVAFPIDVQETLDAIEDLTPLVIEGGELPQETLNHQDMLFAAICDWLGDALELGLISKNERILLQRVLHNGMFKKSLRRLKATT